MRKMDRTERVKKSLHKNLHEEKEAVRDYRKAAKKSDPKTAKLFRHIAKEESGHHKELSKRLKQL
jgi:rubrerythrin